MATAAVLQGLGGFEAELKAAAERLRPITVQARTRRMGEGSGVIWSRNGLVVRFGPARSCLPWATRSA